MINCHSYRTYINNKTKFTEIILIFYFVNTDIIRRMIGEKKVMFQWKKNNTALWAIR